MKRNHSDDSINFNNDNNNNNNNNESNDIDDRYPYQSFFRIRTITGFITLQHDDFFHVLQYQQGSSTMNQYNDISNDNDERSIHALQKAISEPMTTTPPPPSSTNHCEIETEAAAATTVTKEEVKSTIEIMTIMEYKVKIVSLFLHEAQKTFVNKHGYIVQTLRLATNPFGEWLTSSSSTNHNDDYIPNHNMIQKKLILLKEICIKYHISFCSLGPSENINDILYGIIPIIRTSSIFSCSANLCANDTKTSYHISKLIYQISELSNNNDDNNNNNDNHIKNGLGNFRFCCSSSNCVSYIPFFPVAKSKSICNYNNNKNFNHIFHFAIGYENGTLFNHLLNDNNNSITYRNNPIEFLKCITNGLIDAYKPIEGICQEIESLYNIHNSNDLNYYHKVEYVGMDVSMNPSLTDHMNGSIAYALEQCLGGNNNNYVFGSPGTLALYSAITTQCFQSKIFQSNIKTIGYNGIMLPLCEDLRLAQLAMQSQNSVSSPNDRTLRISDLLNISNVCGVGIDTVPIPGLIHVSDINNHEEEQNEEQIFLLSYLLLDVVAIACKWNKSLTCRVLPIPNHHVNDMTHFDDSPYLINTKIQSLL